jgi:hypothetical protein
MVPFARGGFRHGALPPPRAFGVGARGVKRRQGGVAWRAHRAFLATRMISGAAPEFVDISGGRIGLDSPSCFGFGRSDLIADGRSGYRQREHDVPLPARFGELQLAR